MKSQSKVEFESMHEASNDRPKQQKEAGEYG